MTRARRSARVSSWSYSVRSWLEPFQHGLADLEQRQTGKLRIEIVRRRHEIVGTDVFAGIDDLLRDLIPLRHDDDQDTRAAERHEFDSLQDGPGRASHREADLSRSARHHVGHAGEQVVHQRRSSGVLAELIFDPGRRPGGPAALEQEIDEDAVATVGRHTPGRRVRLMDEAGFFELSQHVAHRRRGHTKAAVAREHLRRHRFTGLDVFAHERGEQPARPFVELERTHCLSEA